MVKRSTNGNTQPGTAAFNAQQPASDQNLKPSGLPRHDSGISGDAHD